MRPLLDLRMADGSRHFGDLPQTRLWHDVRDHVRALEGARLTGFLCDGVTEGWIDFAYAGRAFTINDQFGEYWFFVDDPDCPDDVLWAVLGHFARLLGDAPIAEVGKPRPLAYQTPEKPAPRWPATMTLTHLFCIIGILAVVAGLAMPPKQSHNPGPRHFRPPPSSTTPAFSR